MKVCPQCDKFSVENDPYTGVERCLRGECSWVNRDKIDLDRKSFPLNYRKFRDSIKIKTKMIA